MVSLKSTQIDALEIIFFFIPYTLLYDDDDYASNSQCSLKFFFFSSFKNCSFQTNPEIWPSGATKGLIQLFHTCTPQDL